jgi:hypothetical protein
MAEDDNQLSEPEATYGNASSKKEIIFFNSFDEAEEYGLKKMAAHSHEERLKNLETLRRRTYAYSLLPNGKIPPLEKIITVIKGSSNEF